MLKSTVRIIIATISLSMLAEPSHATRRVLSEHELELRKKQQEELEVRREKIRTAIRTCAVAVAPDTMERLAHVESTWNEFAIGLNLRGWRLLYQPTNKADAVASAKAYLQKGYKIDLGFTQVSSGNMIKFGKSVEEMFDLCTNLKTGSAILVDCYVRASKLTRNEKQALGMSFSCYNTGNFTGGFWNGYVDKVFRAGVRKK